MWSHVILLSWLQCVMQRCVTHRVEIGVSLCIFGRLESRTFWWINILNILSFLSATNPNCYMSHDDRSNDDLPSLSLFFFCVSRSLIEIKSCMILSISYWEFHIAKLASVGDLYLWNRNVSEIQKFKLETFLVVVIPKYGKCDLWSVFSNSTKNEKKVLDFWSALKRSVKKSISRPPAWYCQ